MRINRFCLVYLGPMRDDGVQQGWHNMFAGAAAVGSKVYFPPYMRDYVGVLDTESEPLTLTRLEPDAGSGITWSSNQFLFHGAAAVGTKVYFSPIKSADVVVRDPQQGLGYDQTFGCEDEPLRFCDR